ncbi:MAG: nitroreductase family protein [Actinobacteria bacterium]|nr:nitroreductase family protein [Actinomycetota bacterium]MBU1609347.1 nitroreductase family protein [Actinomycetota bacterium]MBU2314979.1 nitroreductase family protein [Actinomycetota bacterium]MBU2385055.1 nitroreductase family protein [Actinomycetota bacterium]
MLNRLKNVAKTLLAVTWIRRVYEASNRAVLETFGSSRILTHALYFFSFLTFNREQAAVLRGRRDYYRNKRSLRRPTHVELRRNIHRLEKGLTMVPRRPVFALDYIAETVEFYERAHAQRSVDSDSMDAAEIRWAHDVLRTYFAAITGEHPTIAALRDRFQKLSPLGGDGPALVPFERRNSVDSDVTFDQLYALALRRRSVRWFEQVPVEREKIDAALMVGRQSPTACNRLPYEYRIFDDPDMVRQISGIPFGSAGYSHNIPVIAVVVGKLESYFSPRDRHAIYIDASLSAMAFMLALETQGVSSSVINWPDFEPLERKMQKTLHLSMTDRVIMLIAIGYADPDGLIPRSPKKELSTIRNYNRL